jgi:hypothetical protein
MKKLFTLIAIVLISFAATAQKKKQTTTTTTTTINFSTDTLYKRCGMVMGDTMLTVPTYTLTNLKAELINNSTVISFDAPIVSGKIATGYLLVANQCNGRPDCGWRNNLKCAQVTTNVSSPKLYLNLGQTWLGSTTYIGMISISFSDNCIMMSQQFEFTAPKFY